MFRGTRIASRYTCSLLSKSIFVVLVMRNLAEVAVMPNVKKLKKPERAIIATIQPSRGSPAFRCLLKQYADVARQMPQYNVQ